MKSLFDAVSYQCSKLTTRAYSTSFSLGIYFLHNRLRNPIYAIYGFVRFADEIVDSFEGYDKRYLLEKFRNDTYEAIEQRISLNPVLNSFQAVYHRYGISRELVDTFLNSMAMDLDKKEHSRETYNEYILGSAEVVGLMCLHVFTDGNLQQYEELKPFAMKLGAAFQKINFLRDLKADFKNLGRAYFPGLDVEQFSAHSKKLIEEEIEADFTEALLGIKRLPLAARGGVYLAYVYYYALFRKIKSVPAERVLSRRIRVSNTEKIGLMLNSMFYHKLNLI